MDKLSRRLARQTRHLAGLQTAPDRRRARLLGAGSIGVGLASGAFRLSTPRTPRLARVGTHIIGSVPRTSIRHHAAKTLVYAWTFPTTAVGLIALAMGAVTSSRTGGRTSQRVVDGVLEIHGGFVTWLLTHCTLLEGGASAMTLGHVVLGRDEELLDLTRDHERVHVRQCERWGPLFIPAYLLASAAIYVRGGRAYRDNPFEREAYGKA